MAIFRACPAILAALAALLAIPAHAQPPTTQQGFARSFDIGDGRALYLECRGAAGPGQPTVVLVSGYHDSSDPWSEPEALSLLPQAVGPPVLPGLARHNRVCAYDRPGTLRYIDDLPLTNRSTPVPQPRTARDLVAELHDLLGAAEVPEPYLLVGHSLGGLVALLYARTYPSQVRGIVFVDALSPTFREKLGPLWATYRDKVLNPPPGDAPIPSLREAGSERIDLDASVDQVLEAPPLPRMPLAVLTKTEPFQISANELPPGITLNDIDAAYESAQGALVALAPTTPHTFATGSEHYIQLSQPDLVISATQLIATRATDRAK